MQSFQLDRKSGKNCYMIDSRSLTFDDGYFLPQWKRISIPMHESRFALNFSICFVLLFSCVNYTIISYYHPISSYEAPRIRGVSLVFNRGIMSDTDTYSYIQLCHFSQIIINVNMYMRFCFIDKYLLVPMFF